MFLSGEICKRQTDEWECARYIVLAFVAGSDIQASMCARTYLSVFHWCHWWYWWFDQICTWDCTHNSRINGRGWFLCRHTGDISNCVCSCQLCIATSQHQPHGFFQLQEFREGSCFFLLSFVLLAWPHLHLLHDGTRSLAEAWMGRSLRKWLQNHGCA